MENSDASFEARHLSTAGVTISDAAAAFIEEQDGAERAQKAIAKEYGSTCIVPDHFGGVLGFLYNDGDRGPTEEQDTALRDSKFDCVINQEKRKLPYKAPEKRRKAPPTPTTTGVRQRATPLTPRFRPLETALYGYSSGGTSEWVECGSSTTPISKWATV